MDEDIQKSYINLDDRVRLWRRSMFQSLNNIFLWILKVYVLLSIVELIFFPTLYVVFGVFVSFLGIYYTRIQLCRTSKLLHYPISTISLLFYCLFFEILPLPATLFEMKPIVYNMRNPFQTFFAVFIIHFILLITHSIYIKITNSHNSLRNALRRLGLFPQFSSQEIWFLILGSLCWNASILLSQGLYVDNDRNVNSMFSITEWAFSLFFSGYYLIVFIFFFKKFNNIKGKYKIHYIPIILIAIADFVIGVGTNMRTATVLVFANAVFLLVLYVIYYPIITKQLFSPKFLLVIILAVMFFVGPFQMISEAMVSVRHDRMGKNAIEMLSMTRKADVRKENNLKIEREYSYAWDEEYLGFDMLNRFCSLKIWDESIFHARRLSPEQQQLMRLNLYSKVIDQLPGIIKNKLYLKTDETNREYSLSDYLHYLSTNGKYPLGGMKIGSLAGLGFGLFGFWLPCVLFPLYFIFFYLLDSLVYCKGTNIIFPLFIFANMLDYVGIFSDRHYFLYELRFIFRGYWEMVIFYLISIHIVKRLPFLKH